MVKQATTYEKQMEILKSRQIVIDDEYFCISVLKQLNYYRLTAYMLPFKIKDNLYSKVNFKQIYSVYEFDRKLRSILLESLEEIELLFRTKLAYYHGHKYGPLGYLNPVNYNQKHKHNEFIEEFNKLVSKNKENLFVRHHLLSKDGKFPIWVAVELFPFGMLSRFYADMIVSDKKAIAQKEFNTGFEQVENWLLCLSTLRNRCAHYMRLYYYNFSKWPKNTKLNKFRLGNKIFDYIFIMKYCYSDIDKWKSSVFVYIKSLIEEYDNCIDLDHIGFPLDWEKHLNSY